MLIASCRNPLRPSQFMDKKDKSFIQWYYITKVKHILSSPSVIGTGLKRVIILVHGFNSDPDTAFGAFASFKNRLDHAFDHHGEGKSSLVIGFSWPSDGHVLHYYGDLHDAVASAPALNQTIGDVIRQVSVRPIVIAHSMGSEVAMKARYESEDSDLTYLISGDVPRVRFRRGQKYAKNVESQVVSLYSPHDEVVTFFAQLARWWVRAGGAPFVDSPDRFVSYDAEAIHKGEVNHSTYKNSYGIANWIVEDILARGH